MAWVWGVRAWEPGAFQDHESDGRGFDDGVPYMNGRRGAAIPDDEDAGSAEFHKKWEFDEIERRWDTGRAKLNG